VCPVVPKSAAFAVGDAGSSRPASRSTAATGKSSSTRSSLGRARWARSIGHGSLRPKGPRGKEPAVPLALKQLNPRAMVQPEVRAFFQNEAEALRLLAHPNVVRFHELFTWSPTVPADPIRPTFRRSRGRRRSSHRRFLAMEPGRRRHARSRDLAQRRARQPRGAERFFRDFGPIALGTTSSRCSGPSPPDMHSGLCIAT